MSSTAASSMALGAILAAVGIFTLLFSLARFAIVPQLIPAKQIQGANSILWCTNLLATLIAVYGISVASVEPLPAASLKIACIVYVIAAIAADIIKLQTRPTVRLAPREAVRGVYEYLKKHRGARDVIRLSVGLSFIFMLWNAILIYLIVENFQPGGVDLHPLFLFCIGGCAMGALSAARAAMSVRPQALLCATLCTEFLASLICVSAQDLTVVKFALGLAGLSSGLAVVTLDTMLQRALPTRMRATVAGTRDAIIAALFLVAVVIVERSFEQVPVVNIFRAIGLIPIIATIFVYALWSTFAQFIFRLLALPTLRRTHKLFFESTHYAIKARSTIFIANEVAWLSIATICGTFATDCSFVVISKRTRLLERLLLRSIGGAVAHGPEAAAKAVENKVRTGANVFLMSDDLFIDGSNLADDLIKVSEARRFSIVPCAISLPSRERDRLGVKFGVPFALDRSATATKLAKELSFLKSANGEGTHVG
jgi:hypothetical protein